MIRIFVVLSIMAIYFFQGCASRNIYLESQTAYYQGNYNTAEELLGEYVKKKSTMRNNNYPLYLLTLGDIQFRTGNFQQALETYNAAERNLTVDVGGLSVGLEILKSDSKRLFRGKPHQLAYLHYYMGLCYFMMEDFSAAKIEFQMARQEDQGEQQGQEDDIIPAIFMEGIAYYRMHKYSDAIVSFRKVTEIEPTFPYAWYEIAIIADLIEKKSESDAAWQKYISLVPENMRLERSNDAECIFVVVDLGYGPRKHADVVTGVMTQYSKGMYNERSVAIEHSNMRTDTVLTDDLFLQAKYEGGLVGEAGKKAVSAAARKGLSMLTGGLSGLVVGETEADLRVWFTLPGEIHIALLPSTGEQSVLTVDFYDDKAKKLEHYSQVWYYIAGQKHSEANPVCFKSCYDLHNNNVEHN